MDGENVRYVIKGREIFTQEGILENTSILVENGKIASIGADGETGAAEINLQKYRILPGLIDIHIHGANGFDAMDANYYSLNEISKYLASNGVTSFIPATVTAHMGKIHNAVKNISEAIERGLDGARALGSFIEGPYISKKYRGVHAEDYIREIDVEEIENIIEKSNGTVRTFAIAPEKKNALHVIRRLKEKGIKIALGHTNATYREAVDAVENGASIAVHLYNGMRGLHHREAGMLGAALNDDRMKVEIICDCVHVDIPAIQVAIRCKKKEDIILVSDSMMAAGLGDGKYMLGESTVWVNGNVARDENNSLAGSTLKLIHAVRNMAEKVGVPLKDAVDMASINPATAIYLDKELGSITLGKAADIIAIDDQFNVVFTMVGGRIAYNALEGI